MAISHKEKILIEILNLFKTSPDKCISGTELSNRFGVSRTVISRYIKSLEELGYKFEKRTAVGYRLIYIPDTLHPVEILSMLETRYMGRNYFYCEELESTNDKAISLALQGAPEGSCVVANAQTQGRGRLNRSWLSIPGKGLYISILLRPSIEPKKAPQLTIISAFALIDTLKQLYNMEAKLKWPNDVVVKGKKLAGILSESHVEPQKTRFVVIGTGINVFHRKEDFTGHFRYSPTSVAIELSFSRPIKRQDILCEFLLTFENHYEDYIRNGWSNWVDRMHRDSVLSGKKVDVDTGSGKISGRAIGFSEEGGLIVETPEGKKHTILIGDVLRVTPEG